MTREKIIKPNGNCYAEIWVEEGRLCVVLTEYAPDLQIRMDEKSIPQLIQALQNLKARLAL